MKVLFIHPNFPAQFRHVATALARNPDNEVLYACTNTRPELTIPGVRKIPFMSDFLPPESAHPLALPMERAIAQAEAGFNLCTHLKQQGFSPDVIVAHSGWGASLFVRDAFPDTPLLAYFEWYYRACGADVGFMQNEPVNDATRMQLRVRNMPILSDLEACQFGLVPTGWQMHQFPEVFRKKLMVRHDGIDSDYFAPIQPPERCNGPLLHDFPQLNAAKEIVTYGTRGMEPYRGFPQFMRAVPSIMKERPMAHIVIAGEDRVCYGPSSDRTSWKQAMLEEVRCMEGFDEGRLHFTGGLPYHQYRRLLQCSSAHVYLTRPFVLSWSLLEAMSCGALVVASDTPPVQEVITHGEQGLLCDFHSPDAIATTVIDALEHQEIYSLLRYGARQHIEQNYSLRKLLPGNVGLIEAVAKQ